MLRGHADINPAIPSFDDFVCDLMLDRAKAG